MPKVLDMHHALVKPDYDQELKLKKLTFRCYSKKRLRELYPNQNYRLIGEIKQNNQKDRIARVHIGEKVLPVCELGEHSRLMFRRAGYLCVGGEDYIAVLKPRWAFLILFFGLIGTLLAMIVLLLCLMFQHKTPVINPLPSTDPNLETIGDPTDPSGGTGNEDNLGGSVSMIYSLKAKLDLASGNINILFQNPKNSTHHVVLEMYLLNGDDRVLIASSGRIPGGSALSQMQMLADSAVLTAGTYDALYKVVYYDPNTGERALVETEIVDVLLTVQ